MLYLKDIILDVFEKVKKLIVEQLKIDESHILKDASLIDDLGADSIDTVEIIMSLEVEFDIEILESEAILMRKIEDIVKFIEIKVKK